MNLPRWDRVQQAFESVVELSGVSREARMASINEDDPDLAAALAKLLEADAEPSLLDASLTALAENALRHDHVGALVEGQIGPYKLLRVLGEGGMGVVYLAERLHIGGFVAIKILRDAWMSPMRRERFRMEQQTLARLNHPNIAQIYDAGDLEDGTPWFVMEYVEGTGLTAWVDAHRSPLRTVVDLIRQVTGAVAHAHRHAIVHRDLKPSNILVTEAGEVKLLDFGIVKDLSDQGTSERTSDGLRLMTPAYAAPEQVRGGSIGLFTDIFSLGVLLYELLTEDVPHVGPDKPARKPSLMARSATKRDRLHLTGEEWSDLDVICLTALQPDPERRYASADAFLQDLDAFQHGRVISARPSNFLYITSKFIQRNRVLVAVASVALLLLVAIGIVSTVRITHARDAALEQVVRMNRLQSFTESLFDGGSPSEGPSAELSIATLLRRGEIEAEGMHDDPRLQANMFATLGGVFQRLGQLDRADVLLQRALKERLASFGRDDGQYTESLVDMGLLRRDQRRMDEAEDLIRQALALQQKAATTSSAENHSLWALSSVLTLRGKYAESQRVLEKILAGEQRPGRAETQQFADGLAQLADVRFYLGDYSRSSELNREALAIYRRTAGDGHPVVAHVDSSLGHIAFDQGHFSDAEGEFRKSLALDERWYGPTNPAVAEDLTALARVFSATSRAEEARATLLRALAIQQRSYGHDHSSVAVILNDLGSLAYKRDQDDEAEADFREALGIWRKTYGDHHQFVGLCFANLTGVFIDRKDYTEAERMARQALATYQETLPADHVKVAIIHVKLGRILLREHKLAEAEQETRKGYLYFVSHANGEPSYLAGARKDLLEIAAAEHKPELLAELKTTAVRP